MTNKSSLLEANDLTKSFGGLTAVDDVTMTVQQEEMVGLIGPNGAGKSTLFNLLTGFETTDDGAIHFDGQDITELAPPVRAERGLVRSFQLSRTLTGMSVIDNLLIAGQQHPGEQVLPALIQTSSSRTRESQTREKAEQLLHRLDLWDLHDEYAGNLSGGQKRLLELGRVLMTDPKLLLLDEPMAGVNPELTDRLLDLLQELNQEGMTFLIVEHDMEVIMSLCDRIIGLHNGQVLADGTPQEVQQDEAMVEAYLGGAP